MIHVRFRVLLGMIFAVAISRLLPHPPNFTPVAAMALFGGACFSSRLAAFFVPLAAMLASDAFIGFHRGMIAVYACFAATVCIGLWLRRRRAFGPIAGATLASSLLFYMATNFAVWALGHGRLYPMTLEGLATCYIAAIPFFRNTLLGDGFYCFALFGSLTLAERMIPAMREPLGVVRADG